MPSLKQGKPMTTAHPPLTSTDTEAAGYAAWLNLQSLLELWLSMKHPDGQTKKSSVSVEILSS